MTSDQGAPTAPGLPQLGLPSGAISGPSTFKYFPSNPTLPRGTTASPDDRSTVCAGAKGQTTSKDLSACDIFTYNDTSPLPYDVEATTGLPTFTTIGNNAVTTNAQLSTSLTPGPPVLSPISPTRDYAPAFNDTWHTSGCDPLAIVDPTRRADVDASIVNLFTGHNRIHDFAYRLGLTEPRGAMQVNNFGKGGAEGDPELGNTQNAAATNPVFGVTNQATTPAAGLGLTGRNNANQITLQDGVPGITNQYLFQPILGFYGPCTDGDLDASIFLHEYTHAISNRLVAGPETGLSGQQGGSMGESWSDLVAVEYLQAFDLAGKRGEDPYSVGAYATGDTFEGIRDYNLRPSSNPLNYAEFGFDSTGPEVHADGEIWNAIQMTVREALMKKYDAQFPSSNKVLQAACALGRTADGKPAPSFDGCPGNRRWVTYLFDAMILQANGEPSFVDQKNMMLAADMLRTKGVDQRTMANAFASRGLGAKSASATSDDTDPTPSFASPTAADNATVTFKLVDAATGKPVKGEVYTGHYQARAVPIASVGGARSAKSLKAVNTTPTAPFVSGTYSFVVRAPGYGLQRFTAALTPGTKTQTFTLSKNVASATNGAKAAGDGYRLAQVIDDDEATNGGFDGTEAETPVAGRAVTVDLAGDLNTISKIAVSALHRPADPESRGRLRRRPPAGRALLRPAGQHRQGQDLHDRLPQPGRLLPGRPAAGGRPGPQPAHGHAAQGGQGRPPQAGRPRQPVHRRPGLPRRAGERPDQRLRLPDQRQRLPGDGDRAPGVRRRGDPRHGPPGCRRRQRRRRHGSRSRHRRWPPARDRRLVRPRGARPGARRRRGRRRPPAARGGVTLLTPEQHGAPSRHGSCPKAVTGGRAASYGP